MPVDFTFLFFFHILQFLALLTEAERLSEPDNS